MNGRHFTVLAALGLAASGCNWTVFDDLRDEAPTLVFDEPDDYRSPSYGINLAATTGTVGGEEVSRFGANGGPDSTTLFFEAWNGSAMVLRPLFEFCKFAGDCDELESTSMIGLPSWGGGAGGVCLMTAGSGRYRVECESPQLAEPLPFSGTFDPSGGLGDSLAALVDGANPTSPAEVGVGVAGAPMADSGRGAVYRFDDLGSAFGELLVPDGILQMGSGFGSTVAGTRRQGDEFMVAATAPGTEDGAIPAQVLVFALSAAAPELRACLDPPTGAEMSGFGDALAFGDVDGDNLPDLVVGSDADAATKAGSVWVYAGSDFPATAGAGCQGWGGPPREVECPESLRGVACSNNGFGDAVAVGDVDGDGLGDLLVGAPLSDVDGAGSSGAVYVLPGKTGGPEAADGVILVDSSPESGEEIGRSVLALPSDLDASGVAQRVEVVAGAPRASRFYVFLCSPLEVGDPTLGTRCQPPP